MIFLLVYHRWNFTCFPKKTVQYRKYIYQSFWLVNNNNINTRIPPFYRYQYMNQVTENAIFLIILKTDFIRLDNGFWVCILDTHCSDIFIQPQTNSNPYDEHHKHFQNTHRNDTVFEMADTLSVLNILCLINGLKVCCYVFCGGINGQREWDLISSFIQFL